MIDTLHNRVRIKNTWDSEESHTLVLRNVPFQYQYQDIIQICQQSPLYNQVILSVDS